MKRTGFSVLELIISLSIIATFATLIAISYSNQTNQISLTQLTTDIVHAIEFTKRYSMAHNSPIDIKFIETNGQLSALQVGTGLQDNGQIGPGTHELTAVTFPPYLTVTTNQLIRTLTVQPNQPIIAFDRAKTALGAIDTTITLSFPPTTNTHITIYSQTGSVIHQ